MKNIVVVCSMILALGLVCGNSKCLAADNPEATKKLGGLINEALSSNQIGQITSLLDQGAEIDTVDSGGRTLLWAASMNGHIEIVKLLLSKGAQADKASNDGDTPLVPASFQGHLEIVMLLLANGAQVNKASSNGATALSMACASGRLEVVKLLLSKGADINKASNNGATPLSIARNNAHLEIVKLLLAKGAKSGKDSSPLSPLAKEYLGVCFLEMNRRNISAEPTAFYQDHNICKKYFLKERVAGSFFLTTSPVPCRLIGYIKGNTMVYNGLTLNLENKDREAIAKQYSLKCGKQTPKVQSFMFKGPAK
jgi:hypothetical protein